MLALPGGPDTRELARPRHSRVSLMAGRDRSPRPGSRPGPVSRPYFGYAPDLAAHAPYTAFCFSTPTCCVI